MLQVDEEAIAALDAGRIDIATARSMAVIAAARECVTDARPRYLEGRVMNSRLAVELL
jgi:hypothetical protein